MLVLSGEGPRVTSQLNPPLHVGSNDEISIALTKITFYNSFANVNEGENNCLKITPGKGKDPFIVQIPTLAANFFCLFFFNFSSISFISALTASLFSFFC